MIEHVIILVGFRHRLYLVRLVITVQFHIRRRSHLQDHSHSWPIWFSSHSTPDLIDHDSSISFMTWTTPLRSVMLSFCMLFMRNDIWFDQSLQFNIDFGVVCTYMFGHIIVLSCFLHKQHPVRSITITQFSFCCRSRLFDLSCPVWFLSHIIPSLIGRDNLISFLAYTTPIWLIMSLSYLVFIINYTLSDWSWKFSIIFDVDYTYTIDHVIVMSSFHNRPQLIR